MTRGTALSTAALVVALLGWTSIGEAAREAVLPRNSVGTAQLKKGAVTTAKVRDRSLLAIDFRRGQLPAGPRGPSDAFAERGPGGSVTTTPSTLATIDVPAGLYVVQTNVVLENESTTAAVAVQCTLTVPGGIFRREVTLGPRGSAASTVHSMLLWDDLPSGGELALSCVVPTPAAPYLGTQARTSSPSIAAIKVEHLAAG